MTTLTAEEKNDRVKPTVETHIAHADWVLPAWAALCGLLSGGHLPDLTQDGALLRLSELLLLVSIGWNLLWMALGRTDWATPMREWQAWSVGDPVKTLPYAHPGSIAERIANRLGHFRSWWQTAFYPSCGPALALALMMLLITILLSILLGSDLVLVTWVALTVMQLGLMWGGGRGEPEPGWDALLMVMLPWWAGRLVSAPLSLSLALMALLFAIAWGASADVTRFRGRFLTVAAQVLAGALLIAEGHALAGGGLLVLLAPQMILFPWLASGTPRPLSETDYSRYVRPWLMAAMLIASIGGIAPG